VTVGTAVQARNWRFWLLAPVAVAAVVMMSLFVGMQPAAASVAYSKGDVFAGVGNGKINHYSPAGTFLEALDTTTGPANPPGNETGMCFDSAGLLYATDYDAVDMAKFNNLGGLTVYPFGPGFVYPQVPESCVVDQSGTSLYVGTGEQNNELFKLDTNGGVLNVFKPAQEPGTGGINWIDLNPNNQCQIYYTSEGTLVKRYNVCTDTQLSDFASGLPFGNAGCFALRIRSNGEALVACDQAIVRLNSSGSIMQSYNPGSEADFFTLALDPDGLSFWAAGYTSGHVYKVNIASGSVGTNFVAAPATDAGLAGLAVYGDGPVDPGYPRPRGASPTRASLVPAFNQCTSPNRTHGGPPQLAQPSCAPPVQASNFLTVGTPDAPSNGQGAKSVGSVTYTAIVGDGATVANEANVRITTSISDVRKKSDLTDYAGELQEVATLRVTDRYNSADLATQPANDVGTGNDTPFPVTVPCTTTPADNTVGSTCSITTTANTLAPNAVVEGKRTLWQLGPVQVFDGGSDGVASTAGNTLFMDQGVFVP
jgi:hypothetical protein